MCFKECLEKGGDCSSTTLLVEISSGVNNIRVALSTDAFQMRFVPFSTFSCVFYMIEKKFQHDDSKAVRGKYSWFLFGRTFVLNVNLYSKSHFAKNLVMDPLLTPFFWSNMTLFRI